MNNRGAAVVLARACADVPRPRYSRDHFPVVFLFDFFQIWGIMGVFDEMDVPSIRVVWVSDSFYDSLWGWVGGASHIIGPRLWQPWSTASLQTLLIFFRTLRSSVRSNC